MTTDTGTLLVRLAGETQHPEMLVTRRSFSQAQAQFSNKRNARISISTLSGGTFICDAHRVLFVHYEPHRQEPE